MEVERYHDAGAFREVADPLLIANEAVNNLILGISGTVIASPDAYEDFEAWVVRDEADPVAAAIRTPPHRLILGWSDSSEAIRLLASATGELPGVVGCTPGVETFVQAHPRTARRNMAQGVFQLDEVVAPPPVEGTPRPGKPEEFEAVLGMRLAFEEEAIGEVDPEMARRGTTARLEEQSPLFGLWVHEVDGQVVAISGHSGPTPNGIRIGPVYTPPRFRGRGYASNLVAAESQWLLDSGRTFCFLYTDLANPTSNSIYQRIGYHQIAESAEYSFSPST